MPMSKGNLIAYCILLLVIIGLLLVIFLRKPEVVHDDSAEKVLRDSINVLHKNVEESHQRQESIQRQFDSLSALGPKTIYRTREKIKYIFDTRNPDDLDSIIRATWKTKSSYLSR